MKFLIESPRVCAPAMCSPSCPTCRFVLNTARDLLPLLDHMLEDHLVNGLCAIGLAQELLSSSVCI